MKFFIDTANIEEIRYGNRYNAEYLFRSSQFAIGYNNNDR